MRVISAISSLRDTQAACGSLVAQIVDECAPSLLVVNASADHDIETIRSVLTSAFDCPVHGATSCRGVMSQIGHTVAEGSGIGVMALSDGFGEYGSACVSFGENPRAAASAAMAKALEDADRIGEIPDLVWLSTSPGNEEAVLAGLRDCIGPEVPVVGGSAADNTVSGDWCVFDRGSVTGAGLVVTAIFSSGIVSDVFQNGYSPTGALGTVTRVEGRRVYEIDNQPAYEVYRAWTGNALPALPEATTGIISETTLWPLGRTMGRGGDMDDLLLIHPSAVHPDGSFDVFATLCEGERVYQMHGTADALINRSGQVASLSRSALERKGGAPAGALVVFCGGCMLSVQDRVDEVTQSVRAALGDQPFLGLFTFGEQGRLPLGGNLHGNLMISCVTFGS